MQILLVISLVYILYQDINDRAVYWWLFVITGLLFGALAFNQIDYMIMRYYIGINLVLVALIITVLYGYSNFVLKKNFLNHSFGVGDLLLFIALCFGYPTIAFIVLLSFSLIFALVMHLGFRRKMKDQTAPLAGYVALFFAVSIILNGIGVFDSIYTF
ncbi:general secretion pathway protein [Spongiivirga citrea]|uniref:general secretion pathway protein n=1 Tax=Spongiivirga citrea TaxID=1481457 RepID=UPI001953C6BA|nr:general secretion pathway protein [Spongiivirga citrea]